MGPGQIFKIWGAEMSLFFPPREAAAGSAAKINMQSCCPPVGERDCRASRLHLLGWLLGGNAWHQGREGNALKNVRRQVFIWKFPCRINLICKVLSALLWLFYA